MPPRNKEQTVSDHDRIAYDYLKEETDLHEDILGCILSHNGPWGEGRSPQTELERLHHYADMVSSERNTYIKLTKPVPEELENTTAQVNIQQ